MREIRLKVYSVVCLHAQTGILSFKIEDIINDTIHEAKQKKLTVHI